MTLVAATRLLHSTRRLTVGVVLLLSLQLFGNLYEQVVTNVQTIADPASHVGVGELAPGSPLFFYLPWVPAGLVLAVVLAVRLHRVATSAIARSARWALAWLIVAVIAKAILIIQVNPDLRRSDLLPHQIRDLGIAWALGNGLAIVAVTSALVLLLTWRPRLLDEAAALEASTGTPATSAHA